MGNSGSNLNYKIKIIDNQPIRGIYKDDNLILELYGINNDNLNKKLECYICQYKYNMSDLFVMCNKSPCEGYSCSSCIKKVLDTNIAKGYIVSLESMKCLFCKRISDPRFLSQIYNNYKLLFSFYLRYRNIKKEKEKIKMGYCKCGKIQKVQISNNCNEDIDNQNKNFICDICNFDTIKNKQICRQCNNYIEKTGGCNHITCRCGYQWCWKCKTQWGISNCTSYRCVNDYKFSIIGLLFGGLNSKTDLNQNTLIIKYDKDGFDKKGFDRNGFNKDGYDKNGYDCLGFDLNGKNKFGLTIEDYDIDYYDKDGYDYFGYNKKGFDKNGYDYNGYDKDGYNKQGYDKNGYDKNGYNKYGYDKNGYNPKKIAKFVGFGAVSILLFSAVYFGFY
jgi:hypothetical protein